MTDILDHLHDRVLLCDGAMGTQVQSMNLTLGKDFQGHENCTDILCLSRPDAVREIHMRYFAAGADMVETNTFGASRLTLGEFGIADLAFDINRRAVDIAREAAAEFAGDGRARFILGSIGPGTKLPSLGHVDYDTLEASFLDQARGLIAGGADAILVETCQDPLQIKAAVNAAKLARNQAGVDTPIFVQVTVETTGTLLVGADIAAAATIVQALDVPLMGLNCATGPQEMSEHVRWLSANWPGLVSVQPNAGLPELVDGRAAYPLRPIDLATWQERFLEDDRINLLGGCCGTTPEHIAALDAMLTRRAGGDRRPRPVRREVHWVPSVASLYGQVTMRQENAFLSIGERCNANGSKKFRDCQDREDWDGALAIGKEQVKEGSHTLDVCTAFVGRDEVRDMTQLVSRMRGAVTAPLVIDSTELPVIEAALKLYGGKAIINSINFENGEESAAKRLALARKFGAAVIALTIDEAGMAKDVESKVALAHRLYDFAVVRHGLPAADLMIDPLTFTICTGNQDDRPLASHTLEAIRRIAAELPECQIVLGLSNVSFGLKAAARHVLNSVFLDHALKAGMTGAIVHVSKIAPLHRLDSAQAEAAEDLIFDRRREGYDPLQAFISLFSGKEAGDLAKPRPSTATVEERLKQRIVDGDRTGLEQDLAAALVDWKPLDIINQLLLDGMKEVGELFGSGRMQLPFVLQSAETMKAAVAYLEPFMEKAEGQQKGTVVLATVRGDVHDIGKNLVDIILTNNGYRVINLGIKQPINAIIAAAREHKADAIGMSGLLVKSTVVMRDNLEEMTREGLDLPVLLGGAALTRAFVEEDCVAAYGPGRVAYARDAFDGLDLMAKVVDQRFDEHVAAARAKRVSRAGGERRKDRGAALSLRPVDYQEIRLRRADLARQATVPVPPFWGPRIIEAVPLQTLATYLNETMLFQFHWGYRKAGRSLEEWKAWAAKELRPMAVELLKRCQREAILQPCAVYGYWKCAADGDALVLFEEDGEREAARFALPRQAVENGLCLADFVREIDAPERDVIGLQVVTVGRQASEVARQWFAENRYRDYLYLHGLSVETAEALAEYVHARVRAELGFAAEDDRDIDKLLHQHYRGSRYSFGYPACPNLEDQAQVLRLLGADRIGITLSEEWQLEPEQSTSAVVVLHPQAKYFSV
jgi:5-methyltetrahydrofolate--homocysteine methyltransferase